jgi:hypothetical protein
MTGLLTFTGHLREIIEALSKMYRDVIGGNDNHLSG